MEIPLCVEGPKELRPWKCRC